MRFLLPLALLVFLAACVSGGQNRYPETFTQTIITDRCGNITSRTDARGVVTNYTWDPFSGSR